MSTELYFLILGVVLGIGLAKLPGAIHQIVTRRRLLKQLEFDRRVDEAVRLTTLPVVSRMTAEYQVTPDTEW